MRNYYYLVVQNLRYIINSIHTVEALKKVIEAFRVGPGRAKYFGFCAVKFINIPNFHFLLSKGGMLRRQLNISRIRRQKWRLDNIVMFFTDKTKLRVYPLSDELTPDANIICE